MATGTDIVGAAPFPYGDFMVMLGPATRKGDTTDFKTVAAWRVTCKCKIKRAWWFASEGGSVVTTDCDVKLVDDKDTPQTPIASFAAEGLDDGAHHAMTIAAHDAFLPGESLLMQYDFSNAADEIQDGCLQLELEPEHARPTPTEG